MLVQLLKFVWKHKRSQTAKAVLRKKNGIGAIRLSDFKLYYKATVIKRVWYWDKNRNVDQRCRIQSLEINTHACGQLVHDKGGKNIQMEKRQSLQ